MYINTVYILKYYTYVIYAISVYTICLCVVDIIYYMYEI